MASKKPRSVSTAIVVAEIRAAMPTIRDMYQKEPHFCVGYMWATLALLMEKCGEPRPEAPWNRES